MQAEFEEKQYEQHLNIELLKGSNLLFPPGQMLENTVGFDAALFTTRRNFWKHFPPHYKWYHILMRNAPSGVPLPIKLWQNIDQNIENYPRFKFNVFIQHKRPEYMIKPDASEWASWNTPYYRYKLLSHQQDALFKIDNIIGKNGVVVYACPAFYKTSDLWNVIKNKKVIEASNFCKVSHLNGHTVFTYQKAGNYGIAHSEPQNIESYNLLDRLSELSKTRPSESNTEHILTLGNQIDSIMLESSDYSQQYETISKFLLMELEQLPVASALVKIDIFRFLTRTQLFIGY